MFQYNEVLQSNEGYHIGLQHFNILGYHRIAILQYIANHLFLQRTLTEKLRLCRCQVIPEVSVCCRIWGIYYNGKKEPRP